MAVRITQTGVEVWVNNPSNVRTTQVGAEVWVNNPSNARFTQIGAEVWYNPSLTGPLDGLSVSPTGAWSAGRNLVGNFGGAYYHLTSSAVDTFYDQVGVPHNFTDQGNAGQRPTVGAIGTGSCPALVFGSGLWLVSAAISNFIANNAAFVICTGQWNSITANNVGDYKNHGMWGDQGGEIGLYAKSAGPTASAFAWNGSEHDATGSIVQSQPYVLTLRLDSGTLYLGINGTETSTAFTGTVSALTNALSIGRGWTTSGVYGLCSIAELATFNAVPTLTERNNLITNFQNYLNTGPVTGSSHTNMLLLGVG